MSLGFILSEVGQGLRRNLSMVISVVLVTFVSLTFVGTALLLQFQINEMKSFWYDKAEVEVRLCTDTSPGVNCIEGVATDSQISAVRQMLESAPLNTYIESVEFENREQAYERFLEQFADLPEIEWVLPEFMNEIFWVSLVNPDQADVLIESLSGQLGVERVVDQRAYLEDIFSFLNLSSFTAVAIAALMLVAAALLIATTIRLSAFSRRREISIMRLVGASNGFIQAPFILEGVIAALIGSAMAAGAIALIVVFFIQGYLQSAMTGISFVGLDTALIIAPILLGLGAILAAIAAGFAIHRYLKV